MTFTLPERRCGTCAHYSTPQKCEVRERMGFLDLEGKCLHPSVLLFPPVMTAPLMRLRASDCVGCPWWEVRR